MRVRRRHAGLDPASSLMLYRRSLPRHVVSRGRLFVSLDSCFRRNGSGSVRKNVGRCPHHHAGLDPASSLMLYRRSLPRHVVSRGRLFVSLDSCFRRNGSGSVRKNVGRCPHHHAGLDPASSLMLYRRSLPRHVVSRGRLFVSLDSCFRRNGSGSVRKNVGRCPHHHAGLDPASSLMLYRRSLPRHVVSRGRLFVSLDSCFRRNGSGALSYG